MSETAPSKLYPALLAAMVCADCGKDMGKRADHICEGCGAAVCASCVAGTHRNDDYLCARCRWSVRTA